MDYDRRGNASDDGYCHLLTLFPPVWPLISTRLKKSNPSVATGPVWTLNKHHRLAITGILIEVVIAFPISLFMPRAPWRILL